MPQLLARLQLAAHGTGHHCMTAVADRSAGTRTMLPSYCCYIKCVLFLVRSVQLSLPRQVVQGCARRC